MIIFIWLSIFSIKHAIGHSTDTIVVDHLVVVIIPLWWCCFLSVSGDRHPVRRSLATFASNLLSLRNFAQGYQIHGVLPPIHHEDIEIKGRSSFFAIFHPFCLSKEKVAVDILPMHHAPVLLIKISNYTIRQHASQQTSTHGYDCSFEEYTSFGLLALFCQYELRHNHRMTVGVVLANEFGTTISVSFATLNRLHNILEYQTYKFMSASRLLPQLINSNVNPANDAHDIITIHEWYGRSKSGKLGGFPVATEQYLFHWQIDQCKYVYTIYKQVVFRFGLSLASMPQFSPPFVRTK